MLAWIDDQFNLW